MLISEGLNTFGSESHINKAEERIADHIENNPLVEENVAQSPESGRRTLKPTKMGCNTRYQD